MKVRHFITYNEEVYSLENEINDFIRGRKVIDIKYGVSVSTNGSVCSALVMYEED